MLRSKAFQISMQIAGWILFFSLVIAFLSQSHSEENVWQRLLSPPFWLFFIVYTFLFYVNTYLLIPALYLQNKYVYYTGAIVVLFVLVYFLKPFDGMMSQRSGLPPDSFGPSSGLPPPRHEAPDHNPHHLDIISIILFIMIWSLSTAACVIRQWRYTEQRAARAEVDKANAELSFLKAQINPHFLFNTLNNIYSMAVTKNEATAVSIMKLSNIMRYVTDDATQDDVSLQSEVDCIGDYIDLQRLRLNKKVDVIFSVSGELEGKRISPLILMTFIENVFKYGVSSHESCIITIRLIAEEKAIMFFCRNQLFATRQKMERTGIGIANTRQRLEYLYPGKHVLNITTDDSLYTVHLTLQS